MAGGTSPMTRTTDAAIVRLLGNRLVLGVTGALAIGLWLTALPACRVSRPPPEAPGQHDAVAGDGSEIRPETAPGTAGDEGSPEIPAGDGSLGTCEGDSDCLFQVDTDCCGLCLAQRDTPPPRRACGTTCPDSPPPCLCVEGRCRTGTLPRNAACDPARDLCGRGLKCCGPNPVCALPTMTASGPFCPVPGT
jgi:hypothetical protein